MHMHSIWQRERDTPGRSSPRFATGETWDVEFRPLQKRYRFVARHSGNPRSPRIHGRQRRAAGPGGRYTSTGRPDVQAKRGVLAEVAGGWRSGGEGRPGGAGAPELKGAAPPSSLQRTVMTPASAMSSDESPT